MKRFWSIFFWVLTSVACEKVDDVQTMAVQPGKLIKSVSISGNSRYLYEYDQEGHLISIMGFTDKNTVDETLSVTYDYLSDEKLMVTDHHFEYCCIYNKSGELESITYEYFRAPDYLAQTRVFSHSDGLPVSMSIATPTDQEFIAVRYSWEDGNLCKLSYVDPIRFGSSYNTDSYNYTYSDIINNFEVPIAYYSSIYRGYDYELYPLMHSRNLLQSVTFVDDDGRQGGSTFSYEFDSEGNVIKVTQDFVGGRRMVYDIVYY